MIESLSREKQKDEDKEDVYMDRRSLLPWKVAESSVREIVDIWKSECSLFAIPPEGVFRHLLDFEMDIIK